MHERTIKCVECEQALVENECWWCRDCSITICKSCHLINKHSEHNARPWNRREILQSCVQALESRCSLRSKEAADEEIAIKEFICEVEQILIERLHHQLESVNERDRLIISRINRVLNETSNGDGVVSNHMYHVPSPTGPAWKHFGSVERAKVDAMLATASNIVDLSSVMNDTTVDVRNRGNILLAAARRRSASQTSISSSITGTFSIIASDWSPERLANILIASSSNAPITNGGVDIISTLPYSPQSPPLRREMAPIAEDDTSETGYRSSSPTTGRIRNRHRPPLEPNVVMRTSTPRHDITTTDQTINVELRSPSSMSSAAVDYISGVNSSAWSQASSIAAYPIDAVDFMANRRDSSATPTQAQFDDSISSSARYGGGGGATNTFYFGNEYLSRPIDVCTLPNRRLAVSDSCGGKLVKVTVDRDDLVPPRWIMSEVLGVYITSINGDIYSHLSTDGGSASSLCLNCVDSSLFVSVMQKKTRSIYVFDVRDTNDRDAMETIPCPTEPKVEFNRTRWIAVGARGELFVAAGDNHRSAIWCYDRLKKIWKIIKESRRTRYQYLTIAEDQPEHKAVVLMTCDAAQNRLLLFVVDRKGDLVNEYDLTKTYRLKDHLTSAASAIVDETGNLLILDYAKGKVWVVASVEGGGGVRRMRCLPIEIGAEQALGMCVHDGWVYIACYMRKRVQAVRYVDDHRQKLNESSV